MMHKYNLIWPSPQQHKNMLDGQVQNSTHKKIELALNWQLKLSPKPRTLSFLKICMASGDLTQNPTRIMETFQNF